MECKVQRLSQGGGHDTRGDVSVINTVSSTMIQCCELGSTGDKEGETAATLHLHSIGKTH